MNATAFITGASSGFGRGFALRLAADGYGVALAARRVDRIESLAEEIRRDGGAAIACPCDVAEPSQIRDAVARTEAELGPVDLLIANAGVSDRTPVERFDAEAARRLGLVNWVVPSADLEAETAKLAARLAGGPGHALGETKALLNASLNHALEAQLALEAESFASCAATQDFAEGVTAFIEKRSPKFQGK